MIGQSGIDTDIFKVHSTRSAATSKASSIGISLTDTVKQGQCSALKKFIIRE